MITHPMFMLFAVWLEEIRQKERRLLELRAEIDRMKRQ